MDINLRSSSNANADKITVSDTIFACLYNEPLIHQVVTACLAKKRAGTHKQKTRAEVSGGGKKPWRQKGMGRARAGTIRSPLWRHGGVTFAAVQGDYSQKINKKMYRKAICTILSQLVREERLIAIDNLAVDEPKTKALISLLTSVASSANDMLIVVDVIDDNLALAARNIPTVSVIEASAIEPLNLLSHNSVLMTKAALAKVEEALK